MVLLIEKMIEFIPLLLSNYMNKADTLSKLPLPSCIIQ